MKLGHLCLAAIALAGPALPASATLIHRSYVFAAAAGAAVPHAGTFSFSYDSMSGDSVLTMIDFAIGKTPFTLFNASVAPHAFHWTRPQFILGGVGPRNAETTIEHNTDDFWLIFRADTGTASHFAFSQGSAGFHVAESVTMAAPAVVPEPNPWALFALALGALAATWQLVRPKRLAVRY